LGIGFSINVRSLGQRLLKCKAQQPAIEIAFDLLLVGEASAKRLCGEAPVIRVRGQTTQTMSASADCPSQPAIEIAPTQTMSASGRTGKFEFQPAEAGFVCVDAVSTALSVSVSRV
jgi:hypothetical protein